MKRIVLLDDYQGIALDYGGWDRVPDDWEKVALCQHIADPDELVEALAGAEIVVAMRERTQLPAETLDRLPDLKLLITTGMGNVAIDVAAARRNGAVVCGTGGHGPAPPRLRPQGPPEGAGIGRGGGPTTIGADLAGATLGLVGFGNLGRRMVPVAKAFGMDVAAWSTNLDPEEATAAGVRPVSKEELFEGSDFAS